jgi:hypothetical protein
MKLTTQSAEIFVIGLYSIHFVNLSMATNTWVNPPGAVVKRQSCPDPSKQKARMVVCVGVLPPRPSRDTPKFVGRVVPRSGTRRCNEHKV